MRIILPILLLLGMTSAVGASTGAPRLQLQVSANVLSSCRVDSANEESQQSGEGQRPRMRCMAHHLRPLVQRRIEVDKSAVLRSTAVIGGEQGTRYIRYQIDY